jgi:hypothetical protein
MVFTRFLILYPDTWNFILGKYCLSRINIASCKGLNQECDCINKTGKDLDNTPYIHRRKYYARKI